MKNLEFRAFEILKRHSFTQEDVEAFLDFVREAKTDVIATKKDLTDLEIKLDKQSNALVLEVTNLISELKSDIRQGQLDNVKWMVGMILGQTGLIFALLKMFDKI